MSAKRIADAVQGMARFTRLDRDYRVLLVQAAMLLAAYRLALRFVAFRRMAARLGNFVEPHDGRVASLLSGISEQQAVLARKVSWAIDRAVRHVPFDAVCLPQAMAAHTLLKRRGVPSLMHFGVRKVDGKLEAHAWLNAGEVEVTGYPIGLGFTEIASVI